MAVTLTQPVAGLMPGDTYTQTTNGPKEAWLLSEGYAKQASYTGPGVSNTGPADTSVANNPLFNAKRDQLAANSALPWKGTNDDVVLVTNPNPQTQFGDLGEA